MSLRFPRCARLRASAEFQAVFGEGSRVSGPHLRLHVRFAPEAAGARLGLTVGKRVDARAVGRNRIRRVLRDTFRLQRAALPPGDYVVLAKPEAKTQTAATLRAEFIDLLARAARRAPARAADVAAHDSPLPQATPDGTMPGLPSPPVAPASADPTSQAPGADAPPPTRP